MHATEDDISLFISQKKVDLLARCLSPEQCAKRLAVQDAELKYCREQLAYLARCQADLAATQDVYEKVQAVHQKGLTSVAQVQKSLAGTLTTSEYKRTAITAARAKNPIRPNDIVHYAQRLAYTTFAPLDVPLVHVDASSTWGKFSVSRQVKVNAPEMHASALYQWSAAHAAENVKDVKDESSSLTPSSVLPAAVRSWATYPFPPRKLRKRHLAEVDDNTHSNSSNNDHDTDARKEGQQSSAGERGLKYPALAQERHGRGMKGTNADEDEDEDDEDEDEEEQPSGGGNVFSLMQLLEGNAPAGAAASSMEEAEESSSDSEEDEQGDDFEFG